MNELDHFIEAAEHPDQYAADLKAAGKSLIGYLCSYTPEEIIHAAGFHPFRLFATHDPVIRADRHLQAYCCSLARGVLENALSGRLDFLDGTVFPHSCDTIQRLSDIWRLNTNFGFFADVVLPVKLDTHSAHDYLKDVLRRFKGDLENWTGRNITADALNKSIETYNAIRRQLAAIYRLRSANPECISGSHLSAIVKGSIIMERNSLPDRLQRLSGEIAEGRYTTGAMDGKKRLVISGSLCDHPDFYSILEQSGGVAVWDDLCTGSRFFEGILETTTDPLAALVRRYTERPLCPAKHLSNRTRGEALLRIVREHRARGVVFFLLKFCDPHAFDYPYLKEYLEADGVLVTLIEVEDQLPPEGQLKTRLETFIHML